MKILLSNGSILDVKYCVDNNGTLYYQRGIPKDLQGRFGASIIKIKLDPKSTDSLAKQVQNYSANHSALFEALHKNPALTASAQKLNSLTLLQHYKLKEGDAQILDDFASDDPAVVEVIDKSQVDKVLDFKSDYDAKEAAGTITPTDELAYKMLYQPLPLVLSETLGIYLKNHAKGNDPEYQKSVAIHWDKLIKLVGDIPLVNLNRTHARTYRDKRLLQFKDKEKRVPIKPASVEREINQIKAIITKVIREQELAMRNPFEAIVIPNVRGGSKLREPFTHDEMRLLLNAVKGQFDEVRRIIAIQAYTGARISEIAGLRVKDVVNGKLPYITIRPYGKRTLKTVQSERDVPLVGLAVGAIKSQLAENAEADLALFPRYCSQDGKVNGDAISAIVNQYIRSLGVDKTSHSLRHTMRDLMREANISSEIVHEIGGWGAQVIGDRYGKGHALELKQDALEKATSVIELNDEPIQIAQMPHKSPRKAVVAIQRHKQGKVSLGQRRSLVAPKKLAEKAQVTGVRTRPSDPDIDGVTSRRNTQVARPARSKSKR